MTAPLTLTVVIRAPVYVSLAAELFTLPDPRARAGWLKWLAEEGVRASHANSHRHARDMPRVPLSQRAGSGCQVFDMRVAVRNEEFPNLYAALKEQQNPRARAALLRRFAEEGLRWFRNESAPVSAQASQAQLHAPSATGSDVHLNSLSLPPGAVPPDFLAGMVASKSIG
jgi:hypothetical protein